MHPKSHRKEPYVQLFLLLSGRVEKLLIRMIIVVAALLIGMQALLQVSSLRQWMTEVDQLEGIPYGYSSEMNVK